MPYCGRCDRHFPHHRALWQHEQNSSAHHICNDCDRDFATWEGLKEHYVQSPSHSYCQYCDEHFDDDDDLQEHYDDSHYSCKSCNVMFKNDIGLHEHNRQKHWYCESCRRVFRNENNLNGHLNSAEHKPKNVRCPGANCGRAFVSMSALLLHFEAGTCPSGMTRAELNRRVIQWDRNNVVTNPARLIRGPDGYSSPETTTTWATSRSWNTAIGAYECFLCHNSFSALGALNAHLKSPRHQEKIYRCPNRATCGVEFSVLSALTQHVESDRCGVQRFRDVRDTLDSLVNRMKTISI